MINNLLRLVILLIAVSNCGPLLAQQTSTDEPLKYYDVEIIVFKNESLIPVGSETNLPTPSATPTPETLDLSDPLSIEQALQRGFTPLTLDELQLKDTVDRIVRSSRYSLLTHTGWRQPGLDENNSIPVWIKGGRTYGRGYSSIDQVTMPMAQPKIMAGTNNPAITKPAAVPAPAASPVLYELEGMITVTLSRYLHTRADLVLRKPGDTQMRIQQPVDNPDQLALTEMETSEGELLFNYGLKEQRRMRSRKLHYLDHPYFGMLVLITPYEAAESAIPPEPPVDQGSPSISAVQSSVVTRQ